MTNMEEPIATSNQFTHTKVIQFPSMCLSRNNQFLQTSLIGKSADHHRK